MNNDRLPTVEERAHEIAMLAEECPELCPLMISSPGRVSFHRAALIHAASELADAYALRAAFAWREDRHLMALPDIDEGDEDAPSE